MKNAFSTFVFGAYERFIPYYILSINKNYPNADIVIFYSGLLSDSIKDFIQKKELNVTIYEKFYQDKIEYIKPFKLRGGGSMTLLRFLIGSEYFKNYEYVFFGDVDIMILKEEKSLFEFHDEQSRYAQMPFSNKVRKLPDSKKLSKRLTGLHFVKAKEYFEKIDTLIEKFFNDQRFRDELMLNVSRDEEFLYKLNQLAFGFNPSILSRNKRPWHGFHLGLVRGKNYLNLKTVEENSSISLSDLKQQLADFNKDGTINRMLIKYTCKEVFFTYKYLNLPLSNKVILKYTLLQKKHFILSKLRKIKSKIF